MLGFWKILRTQSRSGVNSVSFKRCSKIVDRDLFKELPAKR